jgi:flagellin-like hook-associated protein FlgL
MIGAAQQRFASAAQILSQFSLQREAAGARIRDVDVAREVSQLTMAQIRK